MSVSPCQADDDEAVGMVEAHLVQGLTLVHFSAQLEPCLTPNITPHTP